jgi:hypothetical protein
MDNYVDQHTWATSFPGIVPVLVIRNCTVSMFSYKSDMVDEGLRDIDFCGDGGLGLPRALVGLAIFSESYLKVVYDNPNPYSNRGYCESKKMAAKSQQTFM